MGSRLKGGSIWWFGGKRSDAKKEEKEGGEKRGKSRWGENGKGGVEHIIGSHTFV